MFCSEAGPGTTGQFCLASRAWSVALMPVRPGSTDTCRRRSSGPFSNSSTNFAISASASICRADARPAGFATANSRRKASASGGSLVRRLHRDIARERHARMHGDAPIVARDREPQALPSNRVRRRLVVVEHETQSDALAATEAGLVQRAEHRRVGELSAERLAVLFRIGLDRAHRRRASIHQSRGRSRRRELRRRGPRCSVAAGLRPSDSQFDVFEISQQRRSPST